MESGILDANGAEVFAYTQSLGPFYVESPLDTTAPTIERLTPPFDSTDVPVNGPIEIMFEEQINTAAVSESDITVTSQSGSLAHCTLTISPFGVRLSPTVALKDNTLYTVNLSGVRDWAGNSSGPVQFSFTTGAGVDFRPPYIRSSFPSGRFVSRTGTLFLTFSEPLHPPSVSASTIYLESDAGNQPPVAVSLDTTGQVVSITPTQPLEAGADYQIIVTPLVRDRSGIQFGSSYYRVVTTDSVVDTTPPVLTILPGDGATNVAGNASIFIMLDAPVALESVTPSKVLLLHDGQPVPVELVTADDRLSIRLRPLTPLVPDALYTVSASDLSDISGNMMAGTVSSTFTAGFDPDLASPTLVSSTPAAGESGVPTNTTVQLTFSEPVVGLENAFSTIYPTIPFSVEYSSGGTVVTLTPRIPFDAGDLVRISLSITDLSGNYLEGIRSLSFITAP